LKPFDAADFRAKEVPDRASDDQNEERDEEETDPEELLSA
jgi:hypothetical protein